MEEDDLKPEGFPTTNLVSLPVPENYLGVLGAERLDFAFDGAIEEEPNGNDGEHQEQHKRDEQPEDELFHNKQPIQATIL